MKRVRVFCNCHTRGVEKSHLGSQACHLSGNLWLSCLVVTVVVCVSCCGGGGGGGSGGSFLKVGL